MPGFQKVSDLMNRLLIAAGMLLKSILTATAWVVTALVCVIVVFAFLDNQKPKAAIESKTAQPSDSEAPTILNDDLPPTRENMGKSWNVACEELDAVMMRSLQTGDDGAVAVCKSLAAHLGAIRAMMERDDSDPSDTLKEIRQVRVSIRKFGAKVKKPEGRQGIPKATLPGIPKAALLGMSKDEYRSQSKGTVLVPAVPVRPASSMKEEMVPPGEMQLPRAPKVDGASRMMPKPPPPPGIAAKDDSDEELEKMTPEQLNERMKELLLKTMKELAAIKERCDENDDDERQIVQEVRAFAERLMAINIRRQNPDCDFLNELKEISKIRAEIKRLKSRLKKVTL